MPAAVCQKRFRNSRSRYSGLYKENKDKVDVYVENLKAAQNMFEREEKLKS